MKSVIRTLVSLICAAMLSGCITVTAHMSPFQNATPHEARTSVTEVLACMSDSASQLLPEGTAPIMVIPLDFTDRTTIANGGGDFSGAGKAFATHAVLAFGRDTIVVPHKMDAHLRDAFSNTTDFVSPELLAQMRAYYGVSELYGVFGEFSRNDRGVAATGLGTTGGFDDGTTSVSGAMGASQEKRIVGLNVRLVRLGEVGFVKGLSMNIVTDTSSLSSEIGIGYGPISVGGAEEETVIEGVHSAQDTLAQAAIAEAVNVIFGKALSECWYNADSNPAIISATMHDYNEMPERTRVKNVQRMLNELGYDAGPVDGIIGPKTTAAAHAFTREEGLLPQSLKSAVGLSVIFAELSTRVLRT